MSKEHENRLPDLSLDEVVRRTRELTLEHGEHPPTLITTGSKEIVVGQVANLADTHEGRAQQMFQSGFMMGNSGIAGELKQVFFICESWMSMPKGDNAALVPPSEDPNRIEVVLISNLRIDGEQQQQAIVMLEMLRNRAGKLTGLREIQRIEAGGENRVESPLLTAFVTGFHLGATSRRRRLH